MAGPAAGSPEVRTEADRLLAEARELNREARRERSRARKLAQRFLSRVKKKFANEHRQLAADRTAMEAERERITAEAERFKATYLEFQTASVATAQRFRDSWAELQKQERRAAEERAESEAYIRKQEEALAAREADLTRMNKRATDEKARLETVIAERQQELEGLETRVCHTHAVLSEAEEKRKAADMALIPEAVPVTEENADRAVSLDRKTDRDLMAWAAELDKREQQLRKEQAALGPARAGLAKHIAESLDQRRVLAEQFAMLAAAKERWKEAEQYTVNELEDLTHVLHRRERELDERERGLIASERRRREESYALWQMRLRLDGWRGVITAQEASLHSHRRSQEAAVNERQSRLDRREEAIGRLLAKWALKFQGERERLRTEADCWAVASSRLEMATAAHDRLRNECLATIRSYAAKSLALDQTFKETLGGDENSGPARRFKLLLKRWDRTFEMRRREIVSRVESAVEERRKTNDEVRKLHKQVAEAVERNAAAMRQASEFDRAKLRQSFKAFSPSAPVVKDETQAALRAEVERLAYVLMNTEWPVEYEVPMAEEVVVERQLRAA